MMSFLDPLDEFCKHLLPLISNHIRAERIIRNVERIIATDRWNSFSKFQKTAAFIHRQYERLGVIAENHALPTGGPLSDGRWTIQEAWDVESATLELTQPRRRPLADYRDNPWNLVMWSTSTPPEGLVGEVIVIDNPNQIKQFDPGELRGKFVLTSQIVRIIRPDLVDKGILGYICDQGIESLPHAVLWDKFGWGGWPVPTQAGRSIGFSISCTHGAQIRKAVGAGKAVVKANVKTRSYNSTHQLVCGIIRGRQYPKEEIWAVAHNSEPGAADNASGVAVCIEIATVLNRLIKTGQIDQPRRTIRLLHGYEVHSFTQFYNHTYQGRRPLAAVDIDTVGVKPAFCERKLHWHRPPESVPAHLNVAGERILQATMKLDNSGYSLKLLPFLNAGDNLLNDPQFGMPMPWITNHPFKQYHSSADDVDVLSGRGLSLIATSMGAYLYFLANAGAAESAQLVNLHAESCEPELKRANRKRDLAGIEYAQERFQQDFLALESDFAHSKSLKTALGKHRRATQRAADRIAKGRKWQGALARSVPGGSDGKLIPHRLVPFPPMSENLPPDQARRLKKLKLPHTASFFANGHRNLRQIAAMIAMENGGTPNLSRTVDLFKVLESLGYVRLR